MAYATTGVADEVFVSALSVHDRDTYSEMYERDPEASFFGFMREAGRLIATSQREYSHFEDGSIFENFSIKAVSLPAGDGAVTITLADADHRSSKVYPVVGNQVMFANGSVGYIRSKSAAAAIGMTIVVLPLGGTDVAGGAVVASKVMVFSNAHAEGTGQPESRRTSVDEFKNTTQIFKHTYRVPGSEDSTSLVFSIKGKRYYAVKGEEDTALQHLAEVEMGLIFSPGNNGTFLDKDGNPVYATKGLFPSVAQRGITELYGGNAGGKIAMANIDSVIKKLNKRRAPSEYMMMSGIDIELDLDSMLNSTKAHEAIQYSMIGGKQMAESLGFQSFRKASYSFHNKRWDLLNHDRLAGTEGFKWTGTSIMIPLHKMKDAKSGEHSHAFAVRYKEGNGLNRFHKVWETGANARQNKTEIDERAIHYLTEAGWQGMGLDRYAIIKA